MFFLPNEFMHYTSNWNIMYTNNRNPESLSTYKYLVRNNQWAIVI